MSSSQEFPQSYEQSQPHTEQARIDILRDVDREALLLRIQDIEQSDEACEPDGRIPIDALMSIDEALGLRPSQAYDVVMTGVMHRQIEDETTGHLIVGEPEMFVDEPLFFHGAHEDETVDIINNPEHPEQGPHIIKRSPRVVFYFSRDTDDGEEFYQARFGSVARLERVVDVPEDWTDVTKEIYERSLARLQTKRFVEASRSDRREILKSLCQDAEDGLQALIHHEVPVDIETSRMYHITFEGEGTYTADLRRDDGPNDSLLAFGVIRKVIYLEMGEFEAYGFPPLDDFSYGEGAPFLFVEGDDPDDETVSLIPVSAIDSVDYMDETDDRTNED